MRTRLAVVGFLAWAAGTAVLRIAGQHILPFSGPGAILTVYAVSFIACGGLIAYVCRRMSLPNAAWPSAAAVVILPTLVLDAVTSAFFSTAFPNIPEQAAAAFGGWMLCCCAGAVSAALARSGR